MASQQLGNFHVEVARIDQNTELPLFVGGNKKVSSKQMKFCTSTWCLGGVFRSLFLARCLNNCLEVAELKEDTAVLSVTAGRV